MLLNWRRKALKDIVQTVQGLWNALEREGAAEEIIFSALLA